MHERKRKSTVSLAENTQKHIVLLNGSARPGGNTTLLADAFLRGAEASGCRVTAFSLRRMKIKPCRACDHCVRHIGRCVLRDDMHHIYEALETADAIVFASPVYFYTFSAQIKAAIDRLYNPIRDSFPIMSCALLAVCADDGAETFLPMIDAYRAIAQYLKWDDRGVITAHGLTQKGDIAGHPALAAAESLGRSFG